MELVKDEFGSPAPRLAEVDFDPREATQIYEIMMRRVVQMLCAGVVHGDLSEFNVLLGGHGPVVIDFPQAVDPSKNQNARMLLVRDVENLHRFHQRFVPNAPKLPYAQEMWALFEQNRLTPDTRLSGRFVTANTRVDTSGVMALIGEANRDEMRRRTAHGAGNHRASQNPNHAPHAQARRNDAPQNQGRSSSPTSGAPQAGRRPPLPASGAPQAGRRPQSPPPAARASAGRSPAQTSPAQTSPAQTSGAAPKARRVEIIVEKVARPGGWRGRPNLSVNHPTSFAGDRPSHGPAQARPPQHSDRPAQPARAPVDRAPRGPSQGVRSSQPQPQPNGSRRSHSARRPG